MAACGQRRLIYASEIYEVCVGGEFGDGRAHARFHLSSSHLQPAAPLLECNPRMMMKMMAQRDKATRRSSLHWIKIDNKVIERGSSGSRCAHNDIAIKSLKSRAEDSPNENENIPLARLLMQIFAAKNVILESALRRQTLR